MEYRCRECDSEFNNVLPILEAVVKGEIVRIKHSLENPACPNCMKNALTEVMEAVKNFPKVPW